MDTSKNYEFCLIATAFLVNIKHVKTIILSALNLKLFFILNFKNGSIFFLFFFSKYHGIQACYKLIVKLLLHEAFIAHNLQRGIVAVKINLYILQISTSIEKQNF